MTAPDLTQAEVATQIGVSVRTLEAWRRIQFGPVPYRAGYGDRAPVRYTQAAVDEFKRSQAAWPVDAP